MDVAVLLIILIAASLLVLSVKREKPELKRMNVDESRPSHAQDEADDTPAHNQSNVTDVPKTLSWWDKKVPGWIWPILIGGLTLFALSYHFYIDPSLNPSNFKIFPKDHLSFEHTIITNGDIEGLIAHYDSSELFERISLLNDPFFRTLEEHGLIISRDTTH